MFMVSMKVRSDIENINQFSSGYTHTHTLQSSFFLMVIECFFGVPAKHEA